MKHIKRYFSFAIVFVFVLFGLFSINVNARPSPLNETSNSIYIEGVSVRTTGNAGLRFKATKLGYDILDDNTGLPVCDFLEYGVVIAYGENVSANSIEVGATVNTKSVIYGYTTTLDDLATESYYVTLYNIPATDYDTYVTARACVRVVNKNDSTYDCYVYSSTAVTINLAEVAAKAYNESNTYNQAGNLVYDVATSLPIQVNFKGDSKTYYHDDFSTDFHNQINNKATTLETIVTLGDAEYEKELSIENDHITIYGNLKDYDMEYSTNLATYLDDSALILGNIRIAGNYIEINGLFIIAEKPIILYNDINGLKIKSCKINSGNIAISNEFEYDYPAMYTQNDILVEHCAFFPSAESGNTIKAIYFKAKASNIFIENNYFYAIHSDNNFTSNNRGVVIERFVENDWFFEINNNKFGNFFGNYIIEIGLEGQGSLNAIIYIQENDFTKELFSMTGDGIKIWASEVHPYKVIKDNIYAE